MRYRDKILDYFDNLDDGTVVSINSLYEEKFEKMTQSAFCKAMERLVKDGLLLRVSKGMYAKVTLDKECSEEELIRKKEEAVLNYYFGPDNQNGLYIGYTLYTKYGLTEKNSEEIIIFSNLINKQTANAGRVHIKYTSVELNYDNAKIIETLEILENYNQIDALDKKKFAEYARKSALGYNDENAVYVINNMKYKKSTIAFMKKILDMYKIENSLSRYLSCSTKYKIPAFKKVSK